LSTTVKGLGTTNNHLSAFENFVTRFQDTLPVAKQMLTVMVTGIFTALLLSLFTLPYSWNQWRKAFF